MADTIISNPEKYADTIARYSNPPSPQNLTCVHCGKKFSGPTALKTLQGHLASCDKRILLRFYRFGQYLLILILNPRKKIRTALTELMNDPDVSPSDIAGAIRYLKVAKMVKGFELMDLEKSPEYLKLPNGSLAYRKIFNSLSAENKVEFGATCERAFQNRFKAEEK